METSGSGALRSSAQMLAPKSKLTWLGRKTGQLGEGSRVTASSGTRAPRTQLLTQSPFSPALATGLCRPSPQPLLSPAVLESRLPSLQLMRYIGAVLFKHPGTWALLLSTGHWLELSFYLNLYVYF